MAAAAAPLNVRQVFALTALGIAPGNISLRSTTMTSEKVICVREDKGDGTSQTAFINVATGTIGSRKPISAEAAVVSLDGKNVAVRGELDEMSCRVLSGFDLAQQSRRAFYLACSSPRGLFSQFLGLDESKNIDSSCSRAWVCQGSASWG